MVLCRGLPQTYLSDVLEAIHLHLGFGSSAFERFCQLRHTRATRRHCVVNPRAMLDGSAVKSRLRGLVHAMQSGLATGDRALNLGGEV